MGDHYEKYSPSRTVLVSVKMALWVPNSSSKRVSMYKWNGHHNEPFRASRDVFPPVFFCLNFSNYVHKKHSYCNYIQKYILTMIKTSHQNRPCCQRRVVLLPPSWLHLASTLEAKEQSPFTTGIRTARCPQNGPSSVPLSLPVIADPKFIEGYFWYSTYFEILLHVPKYPFY